MSGLLGAFLVETALVTYRATSAGIKTPKDSPLPWPLPSLYTSAVIIYGGLGLLPKAIAPLPALVGWGLVVATWLNLYTPGAANNAAKANATLGTALGTGSSKAPTSPTTPKK